MKQVTSISDSEWDKLVKNTYGKPYCFQQQDGCRPRGIYRLRVPDNYAENYDAENDTVPEVVNHPEMQVSFRAWLDRPSNKLLKTKDKFDKSDQGLEMWWERNFYPAVEMLANDLYNKGLLPAGEYCIEIDW